MQTRATPAEAPGVRSIVVFWLPLAATWLMMAAEGPYVAAIIARLPSAAFNLAAYGVAFSLAWLAESPIMMLLSASTALVHDRQSFLALRRFSFVLNALVSAPLAIGVLLPSLFRLLTEQVVGLPPELARLVYLATAALLPWPAAIGYRRFYQGVLVRHGLTRRVAYGTVVRLAAMSATAALLALSAPLPGACIGALALSAGVVAEAGASRWMARGVVASLLARPEPPAGDRLGLSEIARFYYPLALTSVISLVTAPLVTFLLGRSRAPIESLAAWPVVSAFVFLFRSGGIAYQEVGIARSGPHGEHGREVRRAAGLLAAAATASLALILWTPLSGRWFGGVAGLSQDLTALAVDASRLLLPLPALEYLLSVQRARLILARRTRRVTIATAIEAAALAAALLACLAGLDMVGGVAAAIALVLGRLAANGFLLLPVSSGSPRPSPEAPAS